MESPVDLLEDEMSDAIAFEKNQQSKEAIKVYEALLKKHPTSEKILSRLMINARKTKDFRRELKYINASIKVQESFYAPQKRQGAMIVSISEKINKSLGATDKKGKKIHTADAIKKLEKRKTLVEKKITEL